MSPQLIDDRGKFWDSGSLELRSKLNTSIGDVELCEFTIMNLGFIGLTRSRETLRVRLRPMLVSQAALGALYVWLHENARDRVAVAWHDGRWQHEIIGWNRSGWRRITSVFEGAAVYSQRFSRTRIHPNVLDSMNPLRNLIEHAHCFQDMFENPGHLLPEPINGRFVLLEESIDHELLVCDLGRTMMARSPSWRRQAIGSRVDDLPDWTYGQWVSEAYREVSRSGEPLIEAVTAMIEWPECGEVWHSYWRVILPCGKPGSPRRLLGVTLDSADPMLRKVA
jgi:hypothetical protein